MSTAERALAALTSLLRAPQGADAGEVWELATRAGELLGAKRAQVYVVDYDQVLLVPLTDPGGHGDTACEPVYVDGTLGGRAYSDVRQYVGSGTTVWSPLLDGTDRLGVVELAFPDAVGADPELLATCQDLAGLLAQLVVTRSLYGDAIERARRRAPITVPAELQWRLLPPLTYVSPAVSVAGALAPTNEVAGDSFDYAINGDTAHVALFDAMGHGLEATLLSAVAMASLRNARRTGLGLGLVDTVHAVERELAAHFGADTFVTAIIGELDTRDGHWHWVACGQVPALLIRDGRVVKALDSPIGPPLGLGLLEEIEVGEERLEPGDRLLLYTDGVIEARDAEGEFFGAERLADFVTRQEAAGRPAAETLRRLNLAVLDYQGGRLQDDATTVLIEWRTEQAQHSPA